MSKAWGSLKYLSVPLDGRKLLKGYSEYIRASIEWPLIESSFYFFGKGFPDATKSYHSTKSWPVIISDIGCST